MVLWKVALPLWKVKVEVGAEWGEGFLTLQVTLVFLRIH